MNTSNVVAFRTPVQAAIFSAVLVPQLTKGHWAGATPKNHAEPWQAAEVVVDEKKVGVEFEPIKANYDLLNKEMVDSVTEKDLKKIAKDVGVELSRKELRAQLKDMMFIMRTPRGKPLATSHQGLIGRPGRPTKDMIEKLAAPSRPPRAAPRRPPNPLWEGASGPPISPVDSLPESWYLLSIR